MGAGKKSDSSKPGTSHNQKVGKWGEAIAAEYLENLGYQLLEKNIHTQSGELDLITRHEGQIVFIEVKTRTNTRSGFPEDGMTTKKIGHLLEAAQEYLDEHPDLPDDWKIEVVAIVGKPGNYQIELFDSVSYGQ